MFTGTSKSDPDPEIEGAKYLHLPVLDLKAMMQQAIQTIPEHPGGMDFIRILEMSIKAGFISDELYFGFLDSEFGQKSYARLFREMLSL